MHFFAGIGSLFIFSGSVVFAGLTAGHFFPVIELPRLPFGIAGGLCIVTGLQLIGLGFVGELIVSLLRHQDKE